VGTIAPIVVVVIFIIGLFISQFYVADSKTETNNQERPAQDNTTGAPTGTTITPNDAGTTETQPIPQDKPAVQPTSEPKPVACPSGSQYVGGGYIAYSGDVKDCIYVCDQEAAKGYQEYFNTMFKYYSDKIVSDTAGCEGDCAQRGMGYGSCPTQCAANAEAVWEPKIYALINEYKAKFQKIHCTFSDWIN
jgi:hypothetical protein